MDALRQGVTAAGLPADAVSLIEDTTRASSYALMEAVGYVDLLIPRGGAGLIRACVENAKVPCIQTGTGICHIYVDDTADQDKALDIIENAKASRPSVCNAEEVCLVHKDIAAAFLPRLAQRLGPDRAARGLHPVELRLDKRAAALISGTPAGPQDFDTEFLDYILAVGVVDSVEDAVEHIAAHSTGHSDAILSQTASHIERFTAAVDSAAVYVNCSTRFTDGGEFGLGCEMGISTQKLHARGPMGLAELCTYKYIIRGDGQIRVIRYSGTVFRPAPAAKEPWSGKLHGFCFCSVLCVEVPGSRCDILRLFQLLRNAGRQRGCLPRLCIPGFFFGSAPAEQTGYHHEKREDILSKSTVIHYFVSFVYSRISGPLVKYPLGGVTTPMALILYFVLLSKSSKLSSNVHNFAFSSEPKSVPTYFPDSVLYAIILIVNLGQLIVDVKAVVYSIESFVELNPIVRLVNPLISVDFVLESS